MHPSADKTSKTPRIVVFTDALDWHTKGVLSALKARGEPAHIVSLRKVMQSPFGRDPIFIPGFEGELPAAAFVRGISSGTFESITHRLGVLHGLEAAGIPVWNPTRSIEICVDKAATTLRLIRAGVPTPETFVVEGTEQAEAIVREEASEKSPLVLKPIFGSQGKGLLQIRTPADLPHTDDVGDIFYLQRLVPKTGTAFRDYRAFISRGRLVAGMVRVSDEWITNVHQGGITEPWDVPEEALAMSLKAVEVTGAAYAGVDLVSDGKGGFLVLEVNSMPAWTGLQAVTEVNVADRLVEDFLAFSGLCDG